MRIVIVGLVLVLCGGALIALTGCAGTPQQRAEMVALGDELASTQAEIAQIRTSVTDLVKSYKAFDEDINAIAAAARAGEMPAPEALALIETYQTEKVRISGAIDNAVAATVALEAKAKGISDRVAKLREGGVPAWVIALLSLGSGLATIAGGKWYIAAKALRGALTGFGVLSRAADASDEARAESPGPAAAAQVLPIGHYVKSELLKFGPWIATGQREMKKYHSAATAGEI